MIRLFGGKKELSPEQYCHDIQQALRLHRLDDMPDYISPSINALYIFAQYVSGINTLAGNMLRNGFECNDIADKYMLLKQIEQLINILANPQEKKWLSQALKLPFRFEEHPIQVGHLVDEDIFFVMQHQKIWSNKLYRDSGEDIDRLFCAMSSLPPDNNRRQLVRHFAYFIGYDFPLLGDADLADLEARCLDDLLTAQRNIAISNWSDLAALITQIEEEFRQIPRRKDFSEFKARLARLKGKLKDYASVLNTFDACSPNAISRLNEDNSIAEQMAIAGRLLAEVITEKYTVQQLLEMAQATSRQITHIVSELNLSNYLATLGGMGSGYQRHTDKADGASTVVSRVVPLLQPQPINPDVLMSVRSMAGFLQTNIAQLQGAIAKFNGESDPSKILQAYHDAQNFLRILTGIRRNYDPRTVNHAIFVPHLQRSLFEILRLQVRNSIACLQEIYQTLPSLPSSHAMLAICITNAEGWLNCHDITKEHVMCAMDILQVEREITACLHATDNGGIFSRLTSCERAIAEKTKRIERLRHETEAHITQLITSALFSNDMLDKAHRGGIDTEIITLFNSIIAVEPRLLDSKIVEIGDELRRKGELKPVFDVIKGMCESLIAEIGEGKITSASECKGKLCSQLSQYKTAMSRAASTRQGGDAVMQAEKMEYTKKVGQLLDRCVALLPPIPDRDLTIENMQGALATIIRFVEDERKIPDIYCCVNSHFGSGAWLFRGFVETASAQIAICNREIADLEYLRQDLLRQASLLREPFEGNVLLALQLKAPEGGAVPACDIAERIGAIRERLMSFAESSDASVNERTAIITTRLQKLETEMLCQHQAVSRLCPEPQRSMGMRMIEQHARTIRTCLEQFERQLAEINEMLAAKAGQLQEMAGLRASIQDLAGHNSVALGHQEFLTGLEIDTQAEQKELAVLLQEIARLSDIESIDATDGSTCEAVAAAHGDLLARRDRLIAINASVDTWPARVLDLAERSDIRKELIETHRTIAGFQREIAALDPHVKGDDSAAWLSSNENIITRLKTVDIAGLRDHSARGRQLVEQMLTLLQKLRTGLELRSQLCVLQEQMEPICARISIWNTALEQPEVQTLLERKGQCDGYVTAALASINQARVDDAARLLHDLQGQERQMREALEAQLAEQRSLAAGREVLPVEACLAELRARRDGFYEETEGDIWERLQQDVVTFRTQYTTKQQAAQSERTTWNKVFSKAVECDQDFVSLSNRIPPAQPEQEGLLSVLQSIIAGVVQEDLPKDSIAVTLAESVGQYIAELERRATEFRIVDINREIQEQDCLLLAKKSEQKKAEQTVTRLENLLAANVSVERPPETRALIDAPQVMYPQDPPRGRSGGRGRGRGRGAANGNGRGGKQPVHIAPPDDGAGDTHTPPPPGGY